MFDRAAMIKDRLDLMLTDEVGCASVTLTLDEWEAAQKHPTELFGWLWPRLQDPDPGVMVAYSPERIAETVVGLEDYDVESYLLMVEYAINRHIVLLIQDGMELDERVRTVEDELGDTWDHCFVLLNTVQAGTSAEGAA